MNGLQHLYDHLDLRIIVFMNKYRLLAGDVRVWRNIVSTVCEPFVSPEYFCLVGV